MDSKSKNVNSLHAELIYGMRGDMLIHIDDVPSGLTCDCVCPHCKVALIARKGEIRRHHFAHHSTKAACEHGYQTTLHMMAKDILSKCAMLAIPPIRATANKTQFILNWGKDIKIDSVQLEKKVSNIIPDVIIKHEHKGKYYELLVEIVVTHDIDEYKLQKIRALDIATLRIDLTSYDDRNLSYLELEDVILRQSSKKSWVHSPILRKYERMIDAWVDLLPIREVGRLKHIHDCPAEIYLYKDKKPFAYLNNCHTCSCYVGMKQQNGVWNVKCCGKKRDELREFVKKKGEDIYIPKQKRKVDLKRKITLVKKKKALNRSLRRRKSTIS